MGEIHSLDCSHCGHCQSVSSGRAMREEPDDDRTAYSCGACAAAIEVAQRDVPQCGECGSISIAPLNYERVNVCPKCKSRTFKCAGTELMWDRSVPWWCGDTEAHQNL